MEKSIYRTCLENQPNIPIESMIKYLTISACLIFPELLNGQYSVARQWNEVLLEAIRHDYARPTVHARNLFHTSIALYDAWAVFDDSANPFFLGNTVGGFECQFVGISKPNDIKRAREEAMSYAAYRLITHRFKSSPGNKLTRGLSKKLMNSLGYDILNRFTNYKKGSPAALGNYLAKNLIKFGLKDGSNEARDYESRYYETVNPMLIPDKRGNPDLKNPNRWQTLGLELLIDQSGNEIVTDAPQFLGAEWGNVIPFSLNEDQVTTYQRDDNEYRVYHDPGPPPYINPKSGGSLPTEYQWGFEMVPVWASHLDPRDSVMWDISPASVGNTPELPRSLEDYHNYYKFLEGGDPGRGHKIKPLVRYSMAYKTL